VFSGPQIKIQEVEQDVPEPENDTELDAISRELNITELERIAAERRT